MDSNYKDYVLKELDNLVSQIVEASEFNASESYRGLVGSLERQIDYHQECIDKCKQMLLLMNARKSKIGEVVSSFISDDIISSISLFVKSTNIIIPQCQSAT